MHDALEQLYRGQDLSRETLQQLFDVLLRGEMDPIILSSLLTALKIKGESPAEIAGAASALLAAAKPFPRPDYAFCDIVGTGGDGLHTINVSTLSALVGAECGIKVAKHGNRSVSSKTGSSDLLDKLGVRLDMSPAIARRCLDEENVCFLFAPQYHSGIRHAMPVRNALKTRTIFNVLGPLINPARPSYQLMGVYSAELVRPIAETLQQLGLPRGMVVHGAGLDEIAVHGTTQVADINEGQIREYTLTPEDFGKPILPKLLLPHRHKLFGLTITPDRLVQIRSERRPNSTYASLDNCRFEVKEAEAMMRQQGVTFISTTHKSIEEIASTIIHSARLAKRF